MLIFEVIVAAALIAQTSCSNSAAQSASDYCHQCSWRRNPKDTYPDPAGDCHSFYKCFYVNATYAYGIKMTCPPGQHWHEKVLSCLPEGPVPCSDPCETFPVAIKGYYGVPNNCATYYVCSNTASYQFCCPAGTSFNSETVQCENAPNCRDFCRQQAPPVSTTVLPPVVVAGDHCIDSYGTYIRATGEPGIFQTVVDANTVNERVYPLACAATTTFSLVTCRCEGTVQVVPNQKPYRQCLVYLPFDTDTLDHSVHKFYTDVVPVAGVVNDVFARGGGSMLFSGGHVEIPGGKTLDYSGHGSMCFYFKCRQYPCRGGLLSNNKDAEMSEFGLVVSIHDDNVLSIQGYNPYLPIFFNFTIDSSLNTRDGFTHVCLTFDFREGATIYINNKAVMTTSVQNFAILIAGYCPSTLGSDQYWGDFNGYMDEFLGCDIGLTAAEVNAHWEGQAAMRAAGLIP